VRNVLHRVDDSATEDDGQLHDDADERGKLATTTVHQHNEHSSLSLTTTSQL